MKKSNITVLIILLTFALIIIAAGAFISYYYFYTPNFLSVGFSAVATVCSDSACIEISASPLIMMTRNYSDGYAAIEEYMMLHGGYTFKEQLGAEYIFENKTYTISVDSDQKIYWKIWVINEPRPKD